MRNIETLTCVKSWFFRGCFLELRCVVKSSGWVSLHKIIIRLDKIIIRLHKIIILRGLIGVWVEHSLRHRLILSMIEFGIRIAI